MHVFRKISIISLSVVVSASLFWSAGLAADDPEARAIMQKVEDRDEGDQRTADMEMILIDKRGKQRLRQIRSFRMDKGVDTYSLMFFQHPADVKDTGFLTYDYDDPDRDDDQWLYLPALHKTKRIASSDKSGSFMGSDLNYSDMTSRDLEDYDFSFYKDKQTVIDGHKVWVIHSTPRSKAVIKETGYTKGILFVRQDNHVVVRSVSWEEKAGYTKWMQINRLEQIEGIWVALDMQVIRRKGKQMNHKTILRFDNVRFNQDLDEALFTTRRLEKGL